MSGVVVVQVTGLTQARNLYIGEGAHPASELTPEALDLTVSNVYVHVLWIQDESSM